MNSDQLKQLVKLASENYNAPPAQVPRDAMWSRISQARDYNSSQITAPREKIWEQLVLHRGAAVPARLSQRGRPAIARIAGRDIRGPHRRGGWMLVSLASFAAMALFAVIQTRTVPVAGTSPSQTTVALNAFEIPMPGFAFQQDGFTSYAADFPGRWLSFAIDDPISEAYRRAAILHLKRSDALITGFRTLSNDDVINRNMRTTVREVLSNTRLLLNSPASIQAQYRSVFLDLELVLVKMTLLTPSTIASDREQIENTIERKKLLTRMRFLIPAPTSSNAN